VAVKGKRTERRRKWRMSKAEVALKGEEHGKEKEWAND